MSASKFKFVSPGIFINEIDNSERPRLPGAVGPVIIGRSEKGPGMRPVKVESFSDFLEVFGAPIAGGSADDVSRNGNYTAPTYAAFAAQAYLRNSNPITFVRLLGEQHTSATGDGVAGWTTTAPTAAAAGNQGAYGIFLFNKNGSYTGGGALVGCLAGVLYIAGTTSEFRIVPAGTDTGAVGYPNGRSVAPKSSMAQAIISTAGGNFDFVLRDEDPGSVVKTFKINFDKSSGNYIRKVLNTNPTLTNSSITPASALERYWLGPTFERNIDSMGLDTTAGNMAVAIVPLHGNGVNAGAFSTTATPGATPWAFSQFTGANTNTSPIIAAGKAALTETAGSELSVTKLFRLVGLHSGEWESRNLKVSVQDVKQSTTDYEKYGTFSIVVRQSSDTDANPKIIERFSGLNLNPDSPDYIARRLGDMKSEWDYTERRYIEQGSFVNNSSYFRVEVSEQVTSGLASGLLPMGFYGPLKFNDIKLPAGAASKGIVRDNVDASIIDGSDAIVHEGFNAAGDQDVGPANFRCDQIVLPSHPLRASAADSKLKDPTDAYFGIEAHYSGSSRQADDYGHLCIPVPDGKDISHSTMQYSFLFTLQDLEAGTSGAAYTAGSYAGASSIDAAGSTFDVLASGYDRFTMPVIGGFDGVDVAEQDPFRNSLLSGGTEINNYAYNSVRRAIDSVSDEEVVECNIITAPGLTDPSLTSHMIDVCERRGDALAIVDIENDYIPVHESSDASDASSRNPSVSSAVASLKTRGINSSYGAAYFPFVKVRDDASGKVIDCPASVVALGTMGSSARKTELWFAPAGFTRGGLSTGSAGLPVTGVRLRLTSKERDKLYEHNINPIASFPSEGIVIFGQKTLQATPSALDRINVRRLMIFLKREVSRMAATVLFDQNVKTTWARFSSKVEPFLASVRTRFGLSEYRLVLDETTTTAELVDRNVMYAKILLKPARSIEYIAIDFVITDSGASFSE